MAGALIKKACRSMLVVLIVLAACSKNDNDRYHGVDTIDNKLYGSTTYYALGFSFELGKLTSTLEAPAPDITIHVNTDVDGNITGKYINTPNLIESFALAASLPGVAEAEDYFDSLLDAGNPAWFASATNVAENQVWIYKTAKGNYVKFRIIELNTDNAASPPFVEMKFEWRIQPDGSPLFDS
ncbi:MAG: hypothetical protein V2I37_02835 [Marinilabiliaceae bacterium]|jgi:hypothetical protein|nr:hypothetical protein [Marinilabiliaceae bacterium]